MGDFMKMIREKLQDSGRLPPVTSGAEKKGHGPDHSHCRVLHYGQQPEYKDHEHHQVRGAGCRGDHHSHEEVELEEEETLLSEYGA